MDTTYEPERGRYESGVQYRRSGRSGVKMSAFSLGFTADETAAIERALA